MRVLTSVLLIAGYFGAIFAAYVGEFQTAFILLIYGELQYMQLNMEDKE